MSSRVGVIVSLLFVLGIGAAALAVNTRILDTSPQPDIGRANEVLVPGSAPPIPATGVTAVPTAPPPIAPSPRSDDDTSHDNHHEPETPDRDSDD